MAAETNIVLIANLIIEWLEFGTYLRTLLERIRAGEDVTDEELTQGLDDVKSAVQRLKAVKKKSEVDEEIEPSELVT